MKRRYVIRWLRDLYFPPKHTTQGKSYLSMRTLPPNPKAPTPYQDCCLGILAKAVPEVCKPIYNRSLLQVDTDEGRLDGIMGGDSPILNAIGMTLEEEEAFMEMNDAEGLTFRQIARVAAFIYGIDLTHEIIPLGPRTDHTPVPDHYIL